MAAVVVLVTVILIVACFLYRRTPPRDEEQNRGDVQNPANESGNQRNGRLPPVPYSESVYEEPAEYAQLNNFGRVSINENYQSVRRRNEQGDSRNTRENAILGRENRIDYSESGGEELAENTQLDSFRRVPIDTNHQHSNTHGEFGDAEDSVV